jgi:hypothetical protein
VRTRAGYWIGALAAGFLPLGCSRQTTSAMLRLRPIVMTMLVATLGLLPAALSHEIGSDSQRPFAIVIVGGGPPTGCRRRKRSPRGRLRSRRARAA